MQKLYEGIRRFQESYYKKDKEYFESLADGQSPQALFITCVDSRVDPNLITQSMPGELLTLRTPGNIIPPFGSNIHADSSAGTIEIAVAELKVKDIIICGHSGCRAVEMLYENENDMSHTPHLRDWLQLALPLRERVEEKFPAVTTESRQRLTEEENVLFQLDNLQTYPIVAREVKEGRLQLHGWFYDICTGEVSAFNNHSGAHSE